MIRTRILTVSAVLVSFFLVLRVTNAQDGAMSSAPAFSGGVFVTPVPGAPFSAVAEQDIRQVLKDGSSFERKTSALIARDSQGRIRNERHEVLPSSSTRKPLLLSIHIYDPETRLNTYLNPYTHMARQSTLPNPAATEPPSNWGLREPSAQSSNPYLRVEDLGPSSMDGISVHGYRRTVTIPEKASGTGRPVVVTDEYWYSEELHINILTKHNDPRTGELTVTVTQLYQNEPDADLFVVPPDYKVVDMTPPEAESQNPVRVIP
jgi:hypothetical protein